MEPSGEETFQRASQEEGRIHSSLSAWSSTPKSFLGTGVNREDGVRGGGRASRGVEVLEGGHAGYGAYDDVVVAEEEDGAGEAERDAHNFAVRFYALP